MDKSVFIDNSWLEGHGDSIDSIQPVSEEILWSGKEASKEDVDQAFVSSRKAFSSWSLLTLEARLSFINAFKNVLQTSQEKLAETIAQETGKPLWEAKTEVAAMIGKIDISVSAYENRTGCSEKQTPAGNSVIRHRPHGVVAVFGPYNFPGHLPNGHIVPALIAGNTVIFKPSELTPMVASEMVNLWRQAGLPDGVLNMLVGGRPTGEMLSKHEQLDGLFFTGSSTTGKHLHQLFAGTPQKILALEMGGNNPLILEEVSDLKGAIHHTLFSAFVTAGQRCTCARRLFVPTGAWGEQFLANLIEATKKLKVGEWNEDPQPFMGSLISKEAAAKVLAAQRNLVQLGAKQLLGCDRVNGNEALLTPGIVDVTGVDGIPDEEVFGPLLQVYRYENLDQAIESANATRFGLAAGILSDDADHYEQFLLASRAGIINWNKPLTGASSAAPFGGVGDSGNHRPSALYAADYCAYPVASLEADKTSLPENLSPGLEI